MADISVVLGIVAAVVALITYFLSPKKYKIDQLKVLDKKLKEARAYQEKMRVKRDAIIDGTCKEGQRSELGYTVNQLIGLRKKINRLEVERQTLLGTGL